MSNDEKEIIGVKGRDSPKYTFTVFYSSDFSVTKMSTQFLENLTSLNCYVVFVDWSKQYIKQAFSNQTTHPKLFAVLEIFCKFLNVLAPNLTKHFLFLIKDKINLQIGLFKTNRLGLLSQCAHYYPLNLH
jgi:hypothetical protein